MDVVAKYNHNHGEHGQFASGDTSPSAKLGQTSQVVHMPVSVLLRYSRINPYLSDDGDGPADKEHLEYMSKLEQTIRAEGLDAFKNKPVIEVGESGSHAVITDGNHRLWAASRAGIENVPVVLNTGEDDEWARRYGKPVESHLHSELRRIASEHEKAGTLMDIERKSVDAIVTPVEDSKSKHGEFDVILSTADLDRDGDELYPEEWKTPLPDRITFDSDHGMSVASCVGSGKPFINDNGQLQVRGTFASTPHGQAVRTLVTEGHVNSVSVAFRDLKTQKDARPQRELLNGAFVVVPANPKAVVLSAKAAKDEPAEIETKDGGANWRDTTVQAINDLWDNDPLDGGNQEHRTAYFQGVHDLAIKLGAGCPYSDPQATPNVLNANNAVGVGPGNRSADTTYTYHKTLPSTYGPIPDGTNPLETKSSPIESTEESTAPTAEETVVAAEESAEDLALLVKRLAITLRSID